MTGVYDCPPHAAKQGLHHATILAEWVLVSVHDARSAGWTLEGYLMPALSHLKLAALMLVLLSGGCMTGCGSVRWERDYQRGMRRAISEQRRALVQFHSGFNGDCAGMDFDVFSEAKVQEMMQGFVPIRLEMLLNRELARRFDIEQVPAFVIIRPDGTVAGTHAGKLNEEMFRVFLIKHRYN